MLDEIFQKTCLFYQQHTATILLGAKCINPFIEEIFGGKNVQL